MGYNLDSNQRRTSHLPLVSKLSAMLVNKQNKQRLGK